MERNVVVALILSALIIFGFQFYFQSVTPHPAKQPSPLDSQAKQETPTSRAEPEKTVAKEPAPPESVIRSLAPADATVAEEKIITISGPLYEAAVSSRGAKLVSFKLKNFKETISGDDLVNIFNQRGPDTSGPTLELTTRDQRFIDAGLDYQTDSPTNITLNPGKSVSLIFTAVTSDNVAITKSYSFDPELYLIGFSFKLANRSDGARNYLVSLPWSKVFTVHPGDRFAWHSASILLNGQLKDYSITSIKGDEELSGDIGWAGLGDTYFFKSLVFPERPANKVSLFKARADLTEIKVRYGAADMEPGTSYSADLALYLGPREHQALMQAGHDLHKALVYSFYRFLDWPAQGLMFFLRFVYSGFTVGGIKIPGVGNYGWAIILLTVLIKILFIPLTHKSMKSMKRMQDIQPLVAKVKEQYKDDKMAQNKAVMELFREHNASPAGSCLPMLLQFPVFIALYQALAYSIELRHAPFVCIPQIYFCIQDLSAPDPYYVTPVVMGLTMLIQQWLTPTGGDPTQKKIMMIMPVVFTWMFLGFPAGLVLYWMVNNILSIGQQLVTNKMTA